MNFVVNPSEVVHDTVHGMVRIEEDDDEVHDVDWHKQRLMWSTAGKHLPNQPSEGPR